MTITSAINRVSISGDGSTTTFSFPNRFLQPSDLVVILRTNATKVDVVQTLGTHYNVTGEGDAGGGSVIFDIIEDGEPTAGETVIIYNDPGITQGTDFRAGDPLPAETLETTVDLLTLQQQRTRSMADRTPRLSDGDTDGSGAYDANSNKIENLGTPTVTTDAATKTYVDVKVQNAGFGNPTGVTATDSVTSRTLEVRFGEIKNVKDYGAIGNGTNNDTEEIQLAINAAQSDTDGSGGVVYFPSGVYRTEDTLTCAGGVMFLGNGPRASQIRFYGTGGKNMLNLIDPDEANGLADFISIRDLQFRGTSSTATGHGIYAFNPYHLHIENCYIREMGGTGIRAEIWDAGSGIETGDLGRQEHITIRDTWVQTCLDCGVWLGHDDASNHQALIEGCLITENKHAGLKIQKTSQVTVKDTQFTGYSYNAERPYKASRVSSPIAIDGGNNIILENLNFENNDGSTLGAISCTTDTSGDGTTVTTADTSSIERGMEISGTGISDFTTVVSISNGTTFVISQTATASATNSLTFNAIHYDIRTAWDPSTKTVTSNTTRSLRVVCCDFKSHDYSRTAFLNRCYGAHFQNNFIEYSGSPTERKGIEVGPSVGTAFARLLLFCNFWDTGFAEATRLLGSGSASISLVNLDDIDGVGGTDRHWGLDLVGDDDTNYRMFSVRRRNKTVQEFQIKNHGYLEWGSGLGAVDTNLYRSAANVLKTDDTFECAAIVSTVSTLANDGTPTVANGSYFLTGGTTTITDFDDGVVGQTITVKAKHAVQITDGGDLELAGNFVMASGDTITLTMLETGKWSEISRSDTT